MKTPECDRWDHEYQLGDAASESCFKCGKLTPLANRQRCWTARIRRMLAHPERLDQVPAPPDYSTPEKISARAREAAGAERLPCENLYAKFRKAVEKAGGVLESRSWPINPDAVRPQQAAYSRRRRA